MQNSNIEKQALRSKFLVTAKGGAWWVLGGCFGAAWGCLGAAWGLLIG